ncbi:hypothetical protein ACGFI9_30045 [Micromonospora sp. NPDC048930]|uniref:hypothetical protein n=1 Tax=Micromonospora sp. NPDC048930 TaxID=3364261 RepID=UPI00371061FE
MSRYDVEDLLRDAFHGHESEIEDGQQGLVGAVRARVARRRRRSRRVAVGATATAVLVTVGLVPVLTRDRPPSATQVAERRAAEDRAATANWRWESALGAEIRVPDAWGVNDYGCHMTGQPSAVRAGGGPQPRCLTPEAPTKELAFLSDRTVDQPGAVLSGRPLTVDGVPAVRTEGRLPDGRWAGSVTVDSRRVAVTVRTLDQETTRRILDSFRLVETDHAGCAARRPSVPPAPPTGQPHSAPRVEDSSQRRPTPFVPAPTSISICQYPGETGSAFADRLLGSVRLTGDGAKSLAAALNAARPGWNAGHPAASCKRPDPARYDVLLLVRGPDGETRVRVRYSGCAELGLDNGVRRAQLTMRLLAQIMRPLHTGYGVSVDLPD